jgi:hypothetical protein
VSTERARAVLIGIVLGVALVVSLFSPAELTGRFWGDGATYYAMARSLAADCDLRYEARDIERIRREYPGGPEGIFLKRTSGALKWDPEGGFPWLRRVGENEKRVYYAKAFAYPVLAVPFVWLIGSRGLLLANALFLGAALLLAFEELRRQTSPLRALLVALALFFGTVAPVYVLWFQPEMMCVALITAGLVAWRRGHPLLSAILFGVAVYAKYPNLLLALPLGVAPFFQKEIGSFARRFLESLRRGAVLAGTTALLFLLTGVFCGEINYQGGERKTFHQVQFPFEGRVTFGNSGEWMGADQIGPKVEGRDPGALGRILSMLGLGADRTDDSGDGAVEGKRWTRAENAVGPDELARAFPRNLVYFWIGRNAGLILYFAPLAVVLLTFLLLGPRSLAGWLAVASLVLSLLAYIRIIPDNWYGGSGTLGNRYILNALPLAILLVPRGRELLVGVAGALAGALTVGSILLSPLANSLHVGRHTLDAPFRLAPVELTMLNDVGILQEPGRKKQPVGDVGDELTGRPPVPGSYFLYFPDDVSYGREEAFGGVGFWLRGGASGEVIVRSYWPARRMRLTFVGGAEGTRVWAEVGGCREALALLPRAHRTIECDPGPGTVYHDTRLYVVRFRSSHGARIEDPVERSLAAFVLIELDVDREAALSRPAPCAAKPRARG